MQELTPEEMKQVTGGLKAARQGGPLEQLIAFFVRLFDGGGLTFGDGRPTAY